MTTPFDDPFDDSFDDPFDDLAAGPGVTMPGPWTLAIDCGGTGLKASVLDFQGLMIAERVRVRTPYPCPPDTFVRALVDLVAPLPSYDRVSVGLPGIVRGGRVLHTPHYVTVAGPFTPSRPDLVAAWSGYDVAGALADALGAPTIAVNDAEMQGAAVVTGKGFEVVVTLGTGVGFAVFDDGRLVPKIELSAHPLAKGQSYDERLGDNARKAVGDTKWTRRVVKALDVIRLVFAPDRLYVGGGATKHLQVDLGPEITMVPNAAGILGGARLWDRLP
jgi:polyphosphate glucokinase